MWTYRPILSMFLVLGAQSCLIHEELHNVAFEVSSSYHTERVKKLGVWEYVPYITVKWNITEGVDFDGILYQITNSSYGRNANQNIRPPQGFLPPVGSVKPCANVNSSIWTVHRNGSSIQCQVPCEGILDEECEIGGICVPLSFGFKSLRKDLRNFTRPVKFGQRYRASFYVYKGWKHGITNTYQIKDDVLFCRHELISNFKVDKKEADEFCTQNHPIDHTFYTTGPIFNLTIVSTRKVLSTNRGEAVLQWQDPLDVYNNLTIIRYDIFPTNAKVRNDGNTRASRRFADGYYRATLVDIEFGKAVTVLITPVTNISKCPTCHKDGRTVEEIFSIPDMNGCMESDETPPFCVSIDNCDDLPATERTPAQCSCPQGYSGNGRNPTYEGGTGCKPLDACGNSTRVKEVCVKTASCEAYQNATMDFNCTCPQGFKGDGYLRGTGCIYDSSTNDVIIAVICVIALLIISSMLLALYCRKRKRDAQMKRTSTFQVSLFNTIINSNSDSPAGLFGEKWEIDRNRIELKGIVGRGHFGVVQRAVLKTEDGEKIVAVKMTTDAASEDYKTSFKHEMLLLSEIDSHENLLGLIGCCTCGDQSMYMITQFMKYGDLLHFLWKAREENFRESDPIYMINELNVYQIAGQVACGMQYLKKLRIIHGDLAARNILVGEGLSCKISDFGLANNVYEEGLLHDVVEKTIPIRWVSPERLMGGRVPIDWRSDVWSYGVLLYETVTLGSTPYPDFESGEIFTKLKSGYRMPRPTFCTQSLYDIMLQCWEWRPSKRPTFSLLEKKMTEPIRSSSGTYVNLHTVVTSLECCGDGSDTTNSTPRTIANSFAQSFVNESEKLV